MNDTARLAQIRRQLDAIAPGNWSLVADPEGMFVEAEGPMGELSPVLRFNAGASSDEMQFAANAPYTVRFLLGLVDRAISFASRVAPRPADADPPAGRAIVPDARSGLRPVAGRRHDNPPAGEPQFKDFAAECAMKCQEPAFKAFLEDRHGLERPLTDSKVAQKVRSLCGVTSRAELNDGGRAADAWKQLRGEFADWRKAGR